MMWQLEEPQMDFIIGLYWAYGQMDYGLIGLMVFRDRPCLLAHKLHVDV